MSGADQVSRQTADKGPAVTGRPGFINRLWDSSSEEEGSSGYLRQPGKQPPVQPAAAIALDATVAQARRVSPLHTRPEPANLQATQIPLPLSNPAYNSRRATTDAVLTGGWRAAAEAAVGITSHTQHHNHSSRPSSYPSTAPYSGRSNLPSYTEYPQPSYPAADPQEPGFSTVSYPADVRGGSVSSLTNNIDEVINRISSVVHQPPLAARYIPTQQAAAQPQFNSYPHTTRIPSVTTNTTSSHHQPYTKPAAVTDGGYINPSVLRSEVQGSSRRHTSPLQRAFAPVIEEQSDFTRGHIVHSRMTVEPRVYQQQPAALPPHFSQPAMQQHPYPGTVPVGGQQPISQRPAAAGAAMQASGGGSIHALTRENVAALSGKPLVERPRPHAVEVTTNREAKPVDEELSPLAQLLRRHQQQQQQQQQQQLASTGVRDQHQQNALRSQTPPRAMSPHLSNGNIAKSNGDVAQPRVSESSSLTSPDNHVIITPNAKFVDSHADFGMSVDKVPASWQSDWASSLRGGDTTPNFRGASPAGNKLRNGMNSGVKRSTPSKANAIHTKDRPSAVKGSATKGRKLSMSPGIGSFTVEPTAKVQPAAATAKQLQNVFQDVVVSPVSVTGSCPPAASDGDLTSPGTGSYRTSPMREHRQENGVFSTTPTATLPTANGSPLRTVGSAARYQTEQARIEQLKEKGRLLASEPGPNLFNNPVFLDTKFGSSPRASSPTPTPHNALTAKNLITHAAANANQPAAPAPARQHSRSTSVHTHDSASLHCFVNASPAPVPDTAAMGHMNPQQTPRTLITSLLQNSSLPVAATPGGQEVQSQQQPWTAAGNLGSPAIVITQDMLTHGVLTPLLNRLDAELNRHMDHPHRRRTRRHTRQPVHARRGKGGLQDGIPYSPQSGGAENSDGSSYETVTPPTTATKAHNGPDQQQTQVPSQAGDGLVPQPEHQESPRQHTPTQSRNNAEAGGGIQRSSPQHAWLSKSTPDRLFAQLPASNRTHVADSPVNAAASNGGAPVDSSDARRLIRGLQLDVQAVCGWQAGQPPSVNFTPRSSIRKLCESQDCGYKSLSRVNSCSGSEASVGQPNHNHDEPAGMGRRTGSGWQSSDNEDVGKPLSASHTQQRHEQECDGSGALPRLGSPVSPSHSTARAPSFNQVIRVSRDIDDGIPSDQSPRKASRSEKHASKPRKDGEQQHAHVPAAKDKLQQHSSGKAAHPTQEMNAPWSPSMGDQQNYTNRWFAFPSQEPMGEITRSQLPDGSQQAVNGVEVAAGQYERQNSTASEIAEPNSFWLSRCMRVTGKGLLLVLLLTLAFGLGSFNSATTRNSNSELGNVYNRSQHAAAVPSIQTDTSSQGIHINSNVTTNATNISGVHLQPDVVDIRQPPSDMQLHDASSLLPSDTLNDPQALEVKGMDPAKTDTSASNINDTSLQTARDMAQHIVARRHAAPQLPACLLYVSQLAFFHVITDPLGQIPIMCYDGVDYHELAAAIARQHRAVRLAMLSSGASHMSDDSNTYLPADGTADMPAGSSGTVDKKAGTTQQLQPADAKPGEDADIQAEPGLTNNTSPSSPVVPDTPNSDVNLSASIPTWHALHDLGSLVVDAPYGLVFQGPEDQHSNTAEQTTAGDAVPGEGSDSHSCEGQAVEQQPKKHTSSISHILFRVAVGTLVLGCGLVALVLLAEKFGFISDYRYGPPAIWSHADGVLTAASDHCSQLNSKMQAGRVYLNDTSIDTAGSLQRWCDSLSESMGSPRYPSFLHPYSELRAASTHLLKTIGSCCDSVRQRAVSAFSPILASTVTPAVNTVMQTFRNARNALRANNRQLAEDETQEGDQDDGIMLCTSAEDEEAMARQLLGLPPLSANARILKLRNGGVSYTGSPNPGHNSSGTVTPRNRRNAPASTPKSGRLTRSTAKNARVSGTANSSHDMAAREDELPGGLDRHELLQAAVSGGRQTGCLTPNSRFIWLRNRIVLREEAEAND